MRLLYLFSCLTNSLAQQDNDFFHAFKFVCYYYHYYYFDNHSAFTWQAECVWWRRDEQGKVKLAHLLLDRAADASIAGEYGTGKQVEAAAGQAEALTALTELSKILYMDVQVHDVHCAELHNSKTFDSIDPVAVREAGGIPQLVGMLVALYHTTDRVLLQLVLGALAKLCCGPCAGRKTPR